ncbi:hypothetical protein D1007_27148 [Hordeum vulgare]|nr:hypothetical protein D1007_27148 [Hordeum vulgare]
MPASTHMLRRRPLVMRRKVVTEASAMKDIKRRMEKDVNEATKVARLTKSELQQLNKELELKFGELF